MARKQPDDDGRGVEGRTLAGPEARQGRYWPFITGFPFPLGPVLTRQTVRHEVSIPLDGPVHVAGRPVRGYVVTSIVTDCPP